MDSEKTGLKCSQPDILVTKVIKHLSTTNLTWTDTKIQIMTVVKITVRLRGSTEGAHNALEYLVKITMIILCRFAFAIHKNVLFGFFASFGISNQTKSVQNLGKVTVLGVFH